MSLYQKVRITGSTCSCDFVAQDYHRCWRLVSMEIDYEAAEKAYSRGEPSFTIVNDALGVEGDNDATMG